MNMLFLTLLALGFSNFSSASEIVVVTSQGDTQKEYISDNSFDSKSSERKKLLIKNKVGLIFKDFEDGIKQLNDDFAKQLILSESRMGLHKSDFLLRMKDFKSYLDVKVEIEVLIRKMEEYKLDEITLVNNSSLEEEVVLAKYSDLNVSDIDSRKLLKDKKIDRIRDKWKNKINKYYDFSDQIDFMFDHNDSWVLKDNGVISFDDEELHLQYKALFGRSN